MWDICAVIATHTQDFVNHQDFADPPVGQRIGDRIEIDCRVGSGAMGIIYRGRHLLFGCQVAVKILATDSSAIQARRLFRECAVLAKINSPHVVRVVDVGVAADGRHYIATEWLDGQTLWEWINSFSDADRSDAYLRRFLPGFLATLDGLARVHAVGVLHRDIKPDNVILHREGDRIVPKLIDFGLSRDVSADETRLTTVGEILGAKPFVAPEIASGDDHSVVSDVYSAGVVLYLGLTGQMPDLCPREPREINRHVSARISRACMTAIADDPAARWQSAEAFAEALRPRPSRMSLGAVALPAMVIAFVAGVAVGGAFLPLGASPAPNPMRDGLPRMHVQAIAPQMGTLTNRSSIKAPRVTNAPPEVTTTPREQAKSKAAAITADIEPNADELAAAGIEALNGGNYREAAQQLTGALAVREEQKWRVMLAQAYMAQGDKQRAAREYRAVAVRPRGDKWGDIAREALVRFGIE